MRIKLPALLLALFVPLLSWQTVAANAERDVLIKELFPKATVIGEKEEDFPVWPIYQLNELIGYAFESNDHVDFTGFSGERINLLIGLNTDGVVSGVRVLYHHEPIFLHGLGAPPLLEFLDQYANVSLAKRVIVGGSKKKAADTDATVHLDGVTKATVSVIVINDTILASALEVARRKLSDFAQRAPTRIKADFFEPFDWPQLLEKGLVKSWHIDRQQVETALGSSLEDYPAEDLAVTGTDDHIELYYAYLNAPSIGTNLLGAAEYQRMLSRLQPGEHAIAVMSEGFYAYVGEDFRPGTVPARISLVQNGLPVTIRDMNFYDSSAISLAAGVPVIDNIRLFKIRPQTGFDPSAAMELQLIVELAKNHLVNDSATFSDSYSLPANLFEVQKIENIVKPRPVWLTIWQSRLLEIAVLIVSLIVLTFAFLKQHTLTRNARLFHRFRWAFLLFTLLFIGFYAQGQLSVVNIFTVLLQTFKGFDIGVFLLDPVIFILWVYTIISLILWGRGLFCGWLCPFGALQEMVGWIAKKLRIKQLSIPSRWHQQLQLLKYVILLVLVGTAFYSLSAAERMAEVEPFKTAITLVFVRHWPFVVYAVLILAIGLFVHKFYCRYLCPLGAGLAVLGRLRRFEWLTRRSECGTPCQMCSHRCEIGAIKKSGVIDYDECIQCLECIVIINDPRQCAAAVVATKKSLAAAAAPAVVQWPQTPQKT